MPKNKQGDLEMYQNLKKSIFLGLEYLGLYTGIFLIIGILGLIFSQIPTNIFGKSAYQTILSGQFASSVLWIIVCGLVAIILWSVRRKKGGWTMKDLGFKVHKSTGKDIWMGIVFFGLFYLILFPLKIAVFPSKALLSAEELFTNSMLDPSFPLLLLILSFVFMSISTFGAAFWEEIFFRGYLQNLFSRKFSPLNGIFVSFIIFSLGHYFSRPEWGMLDIVSTVISGIGFCLLFYATESLIAVAVMHTLGNLWWDYPEALYLSGNKGGAYFFIIILGIILLICCFIGRKEIQFVFRKIKTLFIQPKWKISLIGIAIGAAALVFEWGKTLLINEYRTENPALLAAIFIIFAAAALSLSFLYRRDVETTAQNKEP